MLYEVPSTRRGGQAMYQDAYRAEYQYYCKFPTSTFFSQRSAFDISLDLVFRSS